MAENALLYSIVAQADFGNQLNLMLVKGTRVHSMSDCM